MEAHNDGSFARVCCLGDEDICADGVVADLFVGRLEDCEVLDFGGVHYDVWWCMSCLEL